MIRRVALVLLGCFCLFAMDTAEAATKAIQMFNRLAVSQGTAKVVLKRGSASIRVKLAPLPATIDTGAEPFDATCYRAYLTSSIDPTIEVPLGNVWPTTKGVGTVKAALKGDLTRLGLDRVVIVAYSKDGQSSFDVLTGTIPVL
jgi:hypothetical protein